MPSTTHRRKLTTKLVKAATYAGKATSNGGWTRHVIWDEEIRGFGLRLLPSGEKTFVLSYRAAGRKRMLSLGRLGDITVVQARERARTHLSEIYDGGDPVLDRKRERDRNTFSQVVEAFRTKHMANLKTGDQYDYYLTRYALPRWGNLPITSITQTDVRQVFHNIGNGSGDEDGHPSAANHFLKIMKSFFKFATEWGHLDHGAPVPTDGIKLFKTTARERRLNDVELEAVFRALAEHPNVHIQGLIWLYLLTAVRKNELLSAKWEHVSWNPGELHIPETKNDRPHVVTLPGPALTILRALDRHRHTNPAWVDNPYIFPGRKAGTRRVNPDKAWRELRSVAGIPDVTIHDLRRTAASRFGDKGHSGFMIQKVLNQKDAKSAMPYVRLGQQAVAEAMNEHAAGLLEAGELPFGDADGSADERGGAA